MEVEEQNTKEQIILVFKFNDINERFSSNSSEPIPGDISTEELQHLVHSALSIASDTANTNYNARLSAISFLLNCFRHSEHEALRRITLTLVSVRILAAGPKAAANPDFISRSLRDYPRLHSAWKVAVRKTSKSGINSPENATFGLIPAFVESLLGEVESIRPGEHTVSEIRGLTALSSQKYLFVLKCVEFICDLLSQLPTRRFFHLYLQATHFLVRLRRTPLYAIQSAAAATALPNAATTHFRGFRQAVGFPQMVWRLERLDAFAVDDFSGAALTPADLAQRGAERAQALQRVCYKLFPDKLRALALSNIGAVQDRETLTKHLARLTSPELRTLAVALGLLSANNANNDPQNDNLDDGCDREFVTEVVLRHLEAPRKEIERDGNLALFPTERDLWPSDDGDEATSGDASRNNVEEDDSGAIPLALPSLNLQFLSADDYLQRNFELFRCESVYGAREGLERAIAAMRPRAPASSSLLGAQGRRRAADFGGASRMALPLREARLVRVSQPALGDTKPSEVLAELSVTLDQCRQAAWRAEWEAIRRHDILYAVRVDMTGGVAAGDDAAQESFAAKYGVVAVRGCEVVDVVDATTGASVLPRDAGMDDGRPRGGALRTIRVRMDGAQYVEDNERYAGEGVRDFYASFNLVVRRREEECNYKAVLETIRSLMSTEAPTNIAGMMDAESFAESYSNRLPDWLENTILGYYSPSDNNNNNNNNTQSSIKNDNTNNDNNDSDDENRKGNFIDFRDTFVNDEHLKSVYPGIEVDRVSPEEYVSFNMGDWCYRVDEEKGVAEAYRPLVVAGAGQCNTVPFTKAQVGAIRAATSGESRLTLVVGPPGTGKTDVAVQIVSNLYHSEGVSRILVVTKSNNALNQIFDKLVELDIDETHCLRLGHGERALETSRDFSPKGRVDCILERRLTLLNLVDVLASSMGVPGHEAYSATCEAALLFRKLYVLPRWEAFVRRCDEEADEGKGARSPFAEFFVRWLGPRERLGVYEEWEYLEDVFRKLRALRPFELLRSPADRANYLLTHEARVVAMTATYAALRRRELQALGFRCDAVVMEEAGQILEVEAFVPLVLLRAPGRVVMIGDHRQLPPVVKCPALRGACRFDQSMFARLVRLGVPTHVLDAQGRARESLAALYSWAYPGGLRTLPSILADPRFGNSAAGNPGFARVCQLVDVAGAREAAPAPHFYQNVAEAEFLVHVYIYMRLLGYPRESVAILTTYNGQRSLLREVVAERCCKTQALRDIVGAPAYVGTVDKFQGRQADYVLLSLVRTESLGHIRDPRRLVVALSRARLGLYIFGSRSLFLRSSRASGNGGGEELSSASKDLRQIMGKLFGESPSALQLIPSERWRLDPIARKDGEVEVKSVGNVDELLPVLAPLVSAAASNLKPKKNIETNNKMNVKNDDKMDVVVEENENGGKLIESMVDVNSEDVIIPIHTNKNVNEEKQNDEQDDDEDMN